MDVFHDIDTWIFDLDNTLYPPECNLFAQIDQRMGAFIADFLEVDATEARRIQKQYFKDYGTTLNGLMSVHNLEPKRFLDYVHDIDHTPIQHNPSLDQAMHDLEGKKFIFTNGTVYHAEQVIDRLGISHHFEDIFDIEATSYIPKPRAQAYHHVLEKTQLDPTKSVLFEDIARNLEVPHDLGMTTVFVKAKTNHPDEYLGILGTGEEDHIHFVTNDLPVFLQDIANNKGKKS
ncbi:MAG: pyrimidine 5'-nucleotidase [Pseudomonadota bacterium]